jgi:tetratricopeptide (TPR) repeat protein
MERPETAIDYWKRFLAVDPWDSPSHASLGHQLLSLDRPREAVASCRSALKLNPDNIRARTDLIVCLVRLRSAEEAQAQFEILLTLRPSDADTLRRWFLTLR